MEVEINCNVLKMVICISIVGLVTKIYREVVMKPKMERWLLKKQGINGPPPMFFLGNLLHMKKAISDAKLQNRASSSPIITHNSAPAIYPYLHKWSKQYGQIFAFSLGAKTVIHVTEVGLLKEIATSTTWDLGRPLLLQQVFGALHGDGIVVSNGAQWAYQRKVLAPHLYLDKIRGMMNIITDSSVALVKSWTDKIKMEGGIIDITIDDYIKTVSGDVIAKACFRSNYSQDENLFSKLARLEVLTSDMLAAWCIPGLRYIPTTKNIEAWVLEKEVNKLIRKIVKERTKCGNDEASDLLQMIVESAESSGLNEHARNKFIIDNCKTMYLAAFDTTSTAASWCLMLLASNPEWQARVRAEVVHVCNGQVPDTNMLLQMKELTMVVQETLRLYSPVPTFAREVLADMKFRGIQVRKGMQIWSHVYTLHTHPDIWGPDSFEFNPERFANGVVGACKFPVAYMPFGVGPRACLGQHLAMTELKALVSLIVANFSFSLSPNYVHSPFYEHFIIPKYGVKLILEKVV